MSRSFRKTPILPIATGASDKAYKAQEHRRERRAVKIALWQDRLLPDPLAFGDPWSSAKDGKRYRAAPAARDMRK